MKYSSHGNSNIRKYLADKYGARCFYCEHSLEVKEIQIEHIEPRSGGGSDDIENLVPSCRRCNSEKGPLPLEVWASKVYDRIDVLEAELKRRKNIIKNTWKINGPTDGEQG